MTDHKKHVAPIIENASRLLADAKIMFESKSYRTATSLAVLSIEEVGKACLVYWKLQGFELFTNDQVIKASHIQKQKVLSAYYFYKEAIAAMKILEGKVTGKMLIDHMFSQPDNRYLKIHIAAKTGSFDTVKQMGFYVDLNDDLKPFTIHATMGELDAKQEISEAEAALVIIDEDERAHSLMAMLYKFNFKDEFEGKHAKVRRDIMKHFEMLKDPKEI